MFSDIPSVREELKARLTGVLPPTWRVEPDIAAPDYTLAPAVYIEFRRIATTFDSQPLPQGVLAAEVQLILTDPRTDRGGEKAVEEHLVALIGVLDPHEDLAWTTAEKQRIERTGSWSWALTLFAFVDITPKE
jgi:hypothetical protein